ncbi:MAG: IS6 family transposase [Methanobacteriota archaeon]
MEYDPADTRQVRALAIVASGTAIEQAGKAEWRIPSSQDGGGLFRVKRGKTQWGCTCKDHGERGLICKHIHAVRLHLAKTAGEQLTQAREARKPEPPSRVRQPEPATEGTPASCPHCGRSLVTRYGCPTGRQAWWCKPCRRKFVPEDGFKRLKGEAQAVTLALDLYFKGLSLRQITDTLAQFHDLQVNHVNVYRWLRRYVDVLTEYAEGLRPLVGDKWNCDEMKVKYGSEWKWLWHVMDRQTRYLLVSHVTEGRDLQDARTVFSNAREIAEKKPQEIVTDGLASYIEAWKQELRVPEGGRNSHNIHVREIHLADHSKNNNIVARLNGTVRDRHNDVRGLKKPEGPLTKRQAVYHNLVKPHLSLGGLTPAEAAGIQVPAAGNRWLGIIRAGLAERPSAPPLGK